jgi:hypothetical protein
VAGDRFSNDGDARASIVNIPITHCGLHNGPLEVWPGGSHLWRAENFAKFNLYPFVQDGTNTAVERLARHIPSKKIELRPGQIMIRDTLVCGIAELQTRPMSRAPC